MFSGSTNLAPSAARHSQLRMELTVPLEESVGVVVEELDSVFCVTNPSKVCMFGVLDAVTEGIWNTLSSGLVAPKEGRCERCVLQDVVTGAICFNS